MNIRYLLSIAAFVLHNSLADVACANEQQHTLTEKIIAEQTLKEWQKQVISEVRRRVSENGFRNSKSGGPTSTVKFKVNRDRSISEFTSQISYSPSCYGSEPFSSVIKSEIRSLEGSPILILPNGVTADAVQFEFKVSSDNSLPASEIENASKIEKGAKLSRFKSEKEKTDIWTEWNRVLSSVLINRIFEQASRQIKSCSPVECKISYRISRSGSIDKIEIETENPLLRELSQLETQDLKNSSALAFPFEDDGIEYVSKLTEFVFPKPNQKALVPISDFEE